MRKIFLFLSLFFATVAPCWAAVVRLVEDSPGYYRLEGERLDGVAALDVLIEYDRSTLQVTNLVQGPLLEGLLFAGNPNQAGRVHIGAVGSQAISGSGTLASLSGSVLIPPVVILRLTAKLNDAAGQLLPVSTSFPRPEIIQDQTTQDQTIQDQTQPDVAQTENQETTSSSSSPGQASSGLVSIKKSDLSTPWSQLEEEPPVPVEPPEPYVDPPEVPESRPEVESRRTAVPSEPYVDKQQVKIPSVLELFEKYEGPLTLELLSPLFDQGGDVFRQTPKILLADGKTSLEIEFPVNDVKAPSVGLRNARLLKSGPVGEGHFRIRCVPQMGALSAKVLFLSSKELMEIPLTVAPRVSITDILIEAGQTLPQIDLDGDGELTWKDNYILVANLLVQRKPAQ